MLLSIQKIDKSFGAEQVLYGITGQIDDSDRIGLIGENGAGKTTLIRILLRELEHDEGDYRLSKGVTVGYLPQNAQLDSDMTVYKEMESAYADVLEAQAELALIERELANGNIDPACTARHGELQNWIEARDGYHMDVQIKKVLSGMDFPPETYKKPVKVLSGGERTRLALAKLLLQQPSLLILDEPTNHLDFVTLEWLEEYLNAYKGAVLAVSHDRYFLDHITNHIWELREGRLTAYKGNYSAFLPQKELAEETQRRRYEAQQEKIQKLQEYVDKNLVRASTTKMAQSRRRQIEKMELEKKPIAEPSALKFKFEYDTEPYSDVLTVQKLTVAIGGQELIKELELSVKRGGRLVIAGPNGTGKSTLLKVLSGRLRQIAGAVRLGSGVRVSFFEQQQERRFGSVLEAVWNQYPKMTELEIRSLLARFAFKGEDVFKDAAALSGGELARLRFAEILLEKPNLMFLDEPTNHLDIYTRESLSDALQAYTGTLVLVTHDRYLMEKLACPILYLEKDGWRLVEGYPKLMAVLAGRLPEKTPNKEEAPKTGQNQKELRRKKAELRAALKDTQDRLELLGADIIEMENRMNDPEILKDYIKVQELCDTLEDAKFQQEELYGKWEILLKESELLEGDEN